MQFPYRRGFKNFLLPIICQPFTPKNSENNQNTRENILSARLIKIFNLNLVFTNLSNIIIFGIWCILMTELIKVHYRY